MTVLWRLLAAVAILVAAVGALLPIVPSVPFLLLAAAAASRGWPRLAVWLVPVPAWAAAGTSVVLAGGAAWPWRRPGP